MTSLSADRSLPMLARCVFNSKANELLLKDAKGLKFRFNDHEIEFRAVHQGTGKNLTKLSWIGSDKRFTDVPDNSLGTQFTDVVRKHGSYFVLQKEPSGWMRMKFMEKPPKNAAYGRIWTTGLVEQPVDSVQSALVEAKKHIMAAAAIVHEYEMKRHIGRTPKKVQEARKLLSSFSTISHGIQLSKAKRGKHVN